MKIESDLSTVVAFYHIILTTNHRLYIFYDIQNVKLFQEEKRNKRVAEVFQEFRRRTARAHHTMDDKLLDVIDTYERQLQQLQRDLELYKYVYM